MSPMLRGFVLCTLVFSAVVIAFAEPLTMPARPQQYRVQRGDTLHRIARRFNTTVSALAALNKLEEPYLIRIDQILRVPAGHGDYRAPQDEVLFEENVAQREQEAYEQIEGYVPDPNSEELSNARTQAYAEFQVELTLDILLGLGEQVQRDAEAQLGARNLAEQGDAEAQYHLGAMYAVGEGVTENDVEAVKWYRQAAEQGHVKAQFFLGVMYADGEGVPENNVEAARWWRKAAEQGHAGAQLFLGMTSEYDVEAVR